MIKVAYVALAPFISGSERSLQVILSYAQAHGIEPYLVTPPGSPLAKWAGDRGITCLSTALPVFSVRNLWSYCLSFLKLYYWLKKHKIQIVHSNQLWSFPLVAAVANQLGIVKYCHFRDPISDAANWWLKQRLDVAVFISQYIEQSFKGAIDPDLYRQTRTLINPILLPERLEQVALDHRKQDCRAKLALPQATFIFGFIGQIADVKGLYETINILSTLENRNWKLVIAGKDFSQEQTYLNKCKALMRESNLEDNLIFLGFVDDTADFYHAIDVVVMLSKEEPLGRVPLEAGGFNTPTLANSTGGLPEIIKHGQTGWLVDMNVESDVVDCVQQALQADLKTMGAAARALSESLAEPNRYTETLSALYQQTRLNK